MILWGNPSSFRQLVATKSEVVMSASRPLMMAASKTATVHCAEFAHHAVTIPFEDVGEKAAIAGRV